MTRCVLPTRTAQTPAGTGRFPSRYCAYVSQPDPCLRFAHPDDDAYGAAGSVALHADEPDFRFVLVHATFGEHGEIRDGFPATRRTLGSIRRAEDEAAWRAIGRVPDRHERLGLPDGGVADVPFDDLVAAVARILRRRNPLLS